MKNRTDETHSDPERNGTSIPSLEPLGRLADVTNDHPFGTAPVLSINLAGKIGKRRTITITTFAIAAWKQIGVEPFVTRARAGAEKDLGRHARDGRVDEELE